MTVDRPQPNRTRANQLHLRLSGEEMAHLQRQAERQGLTLSQVIRVLIRQAAEASQQGGA